MFRKSHKKAERQILDIVNSRANANKCGECGADFPTWASVTLGILLCGRCASCHRKVLSVTGNQGVPISKVKSLTLEAWDEDEIDVLRRGGNKRAAQRWNPQNVPYPYDEDDNGPMEEFLREKYVLRRFCGGASDFDDEYSKHSVGSGTLTPGLRSRLSSTAPPPPSSLAAIPRLSHRKPTSFEQNQFRAKAAKIGGFGYADKDAIYESLVLSNGEIDRALDILDFDARVNPALAEAPPSLPKRPVAQTPETPATSAGSDWWTSLQQLQQLQQQTGYAPGQPQIYQYTDPITGQVSYVDEAGQQYLDPNNPQHQQLLVQQTNPQYLAQQATKQNIMSLYNQPEQYATNVAVPTGQQQQQQYSVQQQYTQQPQFTNGVYAGGQFAQAVPQQHMQTGVQQQFTQQQFSQPQQQQQQQFWR